MKAKALYEKYCPENGIIYDFACGFGGRMLGALSSKKNFKYLKKLSFNSSKTIYQAIIDSNDNVIKYRLILFSSIDEGLKDLFIQNEGYIIIK